MSQNSIEADTTFHNTVQSTAELDENSKNFLNYLNFCKKTLMGTAGFFAVVAVGFLFKASTMPNALLYFNLGLLMVLLSFIGLSLIRANIEMYQFAFKSHHSIYRLIADTADIKDALDDVKKIVIDK